MNPVHKSTTPGKYQPAKLTPLQRQALLQKVNDQLPQTQCTRCGYHDCLSYARAIVDEHVPINRCQPGGMLGIQRLAKVTRQVVTELASDVGQEGPRLLAVIDEQWCIGCTKCIQVCPVDAIVGASKCMHTVIEDVCTGCELCIPVCPVDCIELYPSSSDSPAPTGWAAWSEEQAHLSSERYQRRKARLESQKMAKASRLTMDSQLANSQELSPTAFVSHAHTEQDKKVFISQILAKVRQKSAHQK